MEKETDPGGGWEGDADVGNRGRQRKKEEKEKTK